MSSSVTDANWIIAKAKELGFDLCGVVRISDVPELDHFEEWLARGYAGEMQYLADPRRGHPLRSMPEAKSLIVCGLNYNSARAYSIEAAAEASASGQSHGWISRYAWGDDYHVLMRDKLDELVCAMRARAGAGFIARSYADTGPINERAAAELAGLGWLAKNTCLINETLGSWLFLGVIVTSLELSPPDASAFATPSPDLCGNCRLCIDACPTGALVAPYVMDARLCISYLTIELRGTIPEERREQMGWQVFGCDICQDVCPWNRNAPASAHSALQPRPQLYMPSLEWLLSLDEQQFRSTFRNSAVKRTKWRGLLRNACIAAGNLGAQVHAAERERIQARLTELANSHDDIIADHARCALSRLTNV